jgi:hypothetical protein
VSPPAPLDFNDPSLLPSFSGVSFAPYAAVDPSAAPPGATAVPQTVLSPDVLEAAVASLEAQSPLTNESDTYIRNIWNQIRQFLQMKFGHLITQLAVKETEKEAGKGEAKEKEEEKEKERDPRLPKEKEGEKEKEGRKEEEKERDKDTSRKKKPKERD